jgi:TctA family transporter
MYCATSKVCFFVIVEYRLVVVMFLTQKLEGQGLFWVILVFFGAIFGYIRFSETPNGVKFSAASANIW